MGCDIHAHMEIKVKGEWLYYSPLRILRNYGLFAYLADVRNDGGIVPLSEPRGFPNDVTKVTKLHSDAYGEDGHSHSWISSKEFIKADKKYGFYSKADWSNKIYLFGNGFTGFFENPNEYPPSVEDFRMVFYFDN